MTHFADLSRSRYHGGAYDPANWASPLLAVGWLDDPHPYPTGSVSPAVVKKLEALHQGFRDYTGLGFRGLHTCSLCQRNPRESLTGSQVNLFIPGDGVVFFAPGRIDHYIDEHGYQPPAHFLDSVLNCPEPGSDEHIAALTNANGGVAPPNHQVFHRDRGLEYVTVSPVPYSRQVVAQERDRLIALGYQRALPKERFDALMARLAVAYAEDAPPRSFLGSVRVARKTTRVRVLARTSFGARAAVRHAFGDGVPYQPRAETKPALSRRPLKQIVVPPLPFSDGVLDVAYARFVAKNDRFGQGMNEGFCQDNKARMAAAYTADAPLKQFFGDINIDDQMIALRVMARTPFAAQVAIVAEFGDDYSFTAHDPERDRRFNLKADKQWPPADAGEIVDVPSLPYSRDRGQQLYERSIRKSSRLPSDERAEKFFARHAVTYSRDAPLDEYTGYVMTDNTQTWLRVMARSKLEAEVAAEAAIGYFHTSHLRNVTKPGLRLQRPQEPV